VTEGLSDLALRETYLAAKECHAAPGERRDRLTRAQTRGPAHNITSRAGPRHVQGRARPRGVPSGA